MGWLYWFFLSSSDNAISPLLAISRVLFWVPLVRAFSFGRSAKAVSTKELESSTKNMVYTLPPSTLLLSDMVRTIRANKLQRSQRQPPGSYTGSRGTTLEIRLIQTLCCTQ